MRLIVIFLALVVLAAIGAAVFFRTVPMPAETWHVDPATAPLPTTPNYERLVGDEAPRFPGAPLDIMLRLDAAAKADGAERIGGDVADGFVTYVVRSRIMGFPDAVSIRVHPEGDATRIDIFSRSRFGYSDLGANASRVARWLAAAS
jgi:uncharacterized protein (DUF1499 family)